MTRWLPAVLLAVVAVGATAMVTAGTSDPLPEHAAVVEPSTPLLSPRRVPELLARTVGAVRLRHGIEALLDDPAFLDAEDATCSVVEDDDRELYRLRAGDAFIPASTMKIVTGWAALRRLGAESRLTTEAKAEAAPADGVVEGDLWLVGGGDPLLATADYAASFRNQPQTFTPLEQLADAIVASGVRRITGSIVGDESRYDKQRYVPTWKSAYLANNEIGPLSGLVVNDNFARFEPEPRVRAAIPARHGASVLLLLLSARGVVVEGEAGAGTAPRNAVTVGRVESHTIADIVGEMLTESDNMTAEMLVKELGYRFGGEGSWPRGLAVIHETLTSVGIATAGVVLRDGSGLERDNRLTCSVVMELLERSGPDSVLAGGFAVAGRTGTLADRLRSSPATGRVRVKTGSLDGVAALSGWADSLPGGRLEFAVITNGLPPPARYGRLFQERWAELMVTYPDAPPVEDLAPR